MRRFLIASLLLLCGNLLVFFCVPVRAQDSTSVLNNKICFDLYGRIRTGSNAVFAPTSVVEVLDYLRQGSDGETMRQIERFLRNEDYSPMYSRLNAFSKSGVIDFVTNSYLLVPNESCLREGYLDSIDKPEHKAPTVLSPENISDVRKDLKKDLRGRISSSMKKASEHDGISLMSTQYYAGYWNQQFNPKKTVKEKFLREDGKAVTVRMMKGLMPLIDYADMELFTVAAKSYSWSPGAPFQMIFFLPREGGDVEEVVSWLKVHGIEEVYASLEREIVDLSIPRFEISSTTNLITPLMENGISDLFSEDKADLSKMINARMLPAHVSDFYQEVRIEVNEDGTKVAASTTAEIIVGAGIPKGMQLKEFHLNRPFLFSVIDSMSGLILYIGEYQGR